MDGNHMRESDADRAVRDKAFAVTADELRQFIEQIEAGEAEKKSASDRVKEIYSEAKARGYDAKAMRKIVAMRRRKPDELAEEQAVLELYRAAMGMS